MSRTAISTDQAPKAIGPYSQAIRSGNFLYLSGQIPLDPATMAIVGTSAAEQTEQIMANLAAVLGAAGAGFGDVVKTTIFLLDLEDFAAVNAVYGKRFEGIAPPARSTVQVSRLPRDVRVEIEVVAVLGGG
ncbi:MAG: Rid family detoxifying hydrolase [Deltaproteobacteria bacterium]|jgi:2-iminobutanoate/2-iminopropanoate deaminase